MVSPPPPRAKSGFTLIELSVVLVIIGLIVGGILLGKNLISAAGVRAQISQIEKYNSAVNTFYGKYQALPGDMPDPYATQFGLAAVAPRGTSPGQGDGNGILENPHGCTAQFLTTGSAKIATGEQTVFWVDLSTADLIQGGYNKAREAGGFAFGTGYWPLEWAFPTAAIGNGNYVYTFSGGQGSCQTARDNHNYFGIDTRVQVSLSADAGTPAITVAQAYSIDSKTDDGQPQSGRVQAIFNNTSLGEAPWAAGNGDVGANPGVAAAQTTSTCYDNGSNASVGMQYSMGSLADYGSHMNCALSFQMQGAGR